MTTAAEAMQPEGATAAQNTGTQSVAQLLQHFLSVQQQRAMHYATLDRAFRAFLDNKQELEFRQALQEKTMAFNTCSKQVIATEAGLKEQQRPDLAGLLRCVQENEREKLRLTLSLQSLKQAYAFQALAFQHEEEDADPLEPPAPRTCGCGHSSDTADGHHHHHHHHGGQVEPTRAEFEAAVREAQLLLDASVRTINGIIEEVRELLLDED